MPDPNLPVLVGAAEVANKDPERIVHPVDLLAEATLRAFADAGADVAASIGAVHSAPLSVFSTDDGGAMVAEKLGLPPGERVQGRYSGAAAQRHLAQLCAEIRAGRLRGGLVVGGVADASVRQAARLGIDPPAPPTSIWSQGSDGVGEITLVMPPPFPFTPEEGAGAQMPTSYFALVESALGAGRTPAGHRAHLGELLAPFTEVAATRPEVAWFPEVRTPDELATPTAQNRLVAEPYTKLLCSFPTVDQAAAFVVLSSAEADRLGIPLERRVWPAAITLGHEDGAPSSRRSIGVAESLHAAVTRAGAADAVAFDLYSCFPAAVQLEMAALGLAPDDPRPRTLTGGLPYHGGPGAAYTVHAVAAAVQRARALAGGRVAVVGLGGMVDDFSVGVYSTEPVADPLIETAPTVTAPAVPFQRHASGEAVVDASTVLHERDTGPTEAPVIARLDDGTRVGARAADPELPAQVAGRALVGTTVRLTATELGTVWSPA